MRESVKELRRIGKYINDREGKEKFDKFYRRYKRSEKYADKLDLYFRLTLDGVEPEQAKEECGL